MIYATGNWIETGPRANDCVFEVGHLTTDPAKALERVEYAQKRGATQVTVFECEDGSDFIDWEALDKDVLRSVVEASESGPEPFALMLADRLRAQGVADRLRAQAARTSDDAYAADLRSAADQLARAEQMRLQEITNNTVIVFHQPPPVTPSAFLDDDTVQIAQSLATWCQQRELNPAIIFVPHGQGVLDVLTEQQMNQMGWYRNEVQA